MTVAGYNLKLSKYRVQLITGIGEGANRNTVVKSLESYENQGIVTDVSVQHDAGAVFATVAPCGTYFEQPPGLRPVRTMVSGAHSPYGQKGLGQQSVSPGSACSTNGVIHWDKQYGSSTYL